MEKGRREVVGWRGLKTPPPANERSLREGRAIGSKKQQKTLIGDKIMKKLKIKSHHSAGFRCIVKHLATFL